MKCKDIVKFSPPKKTHLFGAKNCDMEFEELLQQAEQLNADIDSASELPRVECTFPQLVEKGQRLWSRTVGIHDGQGGGGGKAVLGELSFAGLFGQDN